VAIRPVRRALLACAARMGSQDVLDAKLLKALGHPLRMRLLTFVTEQGEASPVQMSRAFDQPLATVSHHTRVLRDLGYLELSRTRPRRGALEHYYRATAAPFLDDEHWELLPVPVRRRVAAQLFRQVLRDAASAGQSGGFDAPSAHVARMVLDLDARGWRDLSGAVLTLLKRAEAIQARSDARREAGRGRPEPPRRSELAVLHFALADLAGSPDGPEPHPRAPRLP
jgi:DNA-binding transcriptional ArsR family regulator